MTQEKKKWGDRKDGIWLKDLPPLNRIMPGIMPNRADNEAYINVDIDLRPLEQYLEIYRKNNLTTRPEAERYIQDVRETNKALYRVFEACGHKAAPTAPDRALFKKWRGMGFSEEMIILAASQATAAESKPPYIDKVLLAWHEAGVTDPAQVSARKTARRPAANAARPGKQVGAQQYTQRDYTESELDSRLTDDILKEAKGNG